MVASHRYAADTNVSSEQTRLELERVLRRYGADQFMSGWSKTGAIVGFRLDGRLFRISLPLPSEDEFAYTTGANQHAEFRRERSARAQANAYELAIRQRWRALLLVVKAQLEAVEAGIFTIQDSFLAHLLLPDGQTVREWVEPQVDHVYATGQMPTSLPGFERVQPRLAERTG